MLDQPGLFPECQHAHTVETREPVSSMHYAREVCTDCKRFVRWIPRPETIQQRLKNRETLTSLAKLEGLDEWTRNFIRSLSSERHLSPRQQKKLDEIREFYLEKKPS